MRSVVTLKSKRLILGWLTL